MWPHRIPGTHTQPVSHSVLFLVSLLCLLVVVMIPVIFGCGGGGTGDTYLTSIQVTPAETSVPLEATRTFTAVGRDQRGNLCNFTPQWSVEGDIGTLSPLVTTAAAQYTRAFTATAVGTGKVVCACGDIRGEADVTVTATEAPVLSEIRMQPETVTCAVNDTREIMASAFDQYGDPIDFAPTWEVVGGVGMIQFGTSSAAVTSTRVFVATNAGSGYVRASCSGVVGQTSVTVQSSTAAELTNLFFLHHSTGNGFVEEGNMRGYIATYNASNGTGYELWDHGYNDEGLRNASGTWTGTIYDIPNDNTDPDGLHTLWTTDNNARSRIMENHEVIAFKSCFPASAIPDTATLNEYKAWYLEMRDYFDAHPERLFVVMSTPPLHRLATGPNEASNARAFANWLKSSEYLSGHPNVVCFDLFDLLAHPDDGSDYANCLKYNYEQSHSSSDSHPNMIANQAVGPALAQFMINAAAGYTVP